MSPRGRPARFTREQLLDAGAAVARRRRRRLRLSDLLGVRLNDVLDEAGSHEAARSRRPMRRVTAPVLYLHWEDFNAYIADLNSYLFSPAKLDLRALRRRGSSWEARLRAHVKGDLRQALIDADLYFALFAGVAEETVRAALLAVYDGYDAQVVPALVELLKAARREVRDGYSVDDIARVLTALTEGAVLRHLVDPKAGDAALFAAAAVAVVQQLTLEAQQGGPATLIDRT